MNDLPELWNHDLYGEFLKAHWTTRAAYLEMLCAAYCKHVGIPPDQAVVCEQTEGTITRWWLELKR